MPVTDFPHVMTITKRLADGTLAEYRYHRRSRVRIFAEWGSPEFAEDYRLAASGHKTAAGRHQIRQRSQDRPRPTFVYFILATVSGMIKIGRADDPKRRFCVLQTGSAEVLELLGTVPDTSGGLLEKTLHRRFRKFRVRGEWFRDDPAIRAALSPPPPKS